MAGGAAAGGAAAAAAIANAIKASGVLVSLEPEDFVVLTKGIPDPLIVHAVGGVWKTKYTYLMGYKGLAFFTKSPEPLDLHSGVEMIRAKSIFIPG